MSARNDGGSAFPMQDGQAIHAYAAGRVADIPSEETDRRDREYIKARANAVGGMTLRDYFAAKAMHAHLITDTVPGEAADALLEAAERAGRDPLDHLCINSYEVADAMLRAREGAL